MNTKWEKVISDQSVVRILVVEDFAAWRQYVLEKLQENPRLRVVDFASDGLEAVRKAEELRPDLILLAIGLPSLNGIEAAKQIRKRAPESKIIFLTLETSAEIVQVALSLGAVGYVSKMSAESDLLAAVAAVMSGKQFISQRSANR
ncbi:MAG: response regulator transcription factor [Candidatus Acidiferrales bacterium]